jgi:hypothetical protein
VLVVADGCGASSATTIDKGVQNPGGQFVNHPPIQPIPPIGAFRRLKERMKSLGDTRFLNYSERSQQMTEHERSSPVKHYARNLRRHT